MPDWKAIADELDIDLDENGKAKTWEDWVRMGACAFKHDEDISMIIMTHDNANEVYESLERTLGDA
jgi:hypothetical protein